MQYSEFIEKVSDGAKFKIDLRQKTVKLNGKEITLEPFENKELSVNELISLLEKLYHNYRYSYPSERSEHYSEINYFKALKAEEMTDEELTSGLDRDVTRACLEGTVLIMAQNGNLKKLFTSDNQWFWKGSNGIVIMKGWC